MMVLCDMRALNMLMISGTGVDLLGCGSEIELEIWGEGSYGFRASKSASGCVGGYTERM